MPRRLAALESKSGAIHSVPANESIYLSIATRSITQSITYAQRMTKQWTINLPDIRPMTVNLSVQLSRNTVD